MFILIFSKQSDYKITNYLTPLASIESEIPSPPGSQVSWIAPFINFKPLVIEDYVLEFKYNFIQIISDKGEYAIPVNDVRVDYFNNEMMSVRSGGHRILVYKIGKIESEIPIEILINGDRISRHNQFFVLSKK